MREICLDLLGRFPTWHFRNPPYIPERQTPKSTINDPSRRGAAKLTFSRVGKSGSDTRSFYKFKFFSHMIRAAHVAPITVATPITLEL